MTSSPPARAMGKWLVAAGCLAAPAFVSSIASAERARVALAQPAGLDEVQAEVATRIRAELETADFEVVVVPLDPGADPRQGVELAGMEPRPIATLAVVRLQNRPAVDVWVSDRVTGKTLVRRLDVGRRPESQVTSWLAIHAVELLRASLLELRTQSSLRDAARAGEGTSPIPNEVAEWVARSIPREAPKALLERPSIAFAAATLYTAGMGPAFAPSVRAAVGASNGLAGRLAFIGPTFGAELRGPRGNAVVRQELALVELIYAPSRRWLVPVVSAGIGGYHLDVRGDATDPTYRGSSHQAWAVVGDAGVGLAARLGSGAALSLDVHGLFAEPAVRIAIGDTSIAVVGRPTILASLGLMAAF